MRRAMQPLNRTLTCWIDQEVREAESVYVNIYKPALLTKQSRGPRMQARMAAREGAARAAARFAAARSSRGSGRV